MNKNARIYVAGHTGLIGSSIVRTLEKQGYTCVITREHAELDLCDQGKTRTFFERERPEYVFFAAARIGGVFANDSYRADFIYENLAMQTSAIHSAYLCEVKKFLFLASADVYPAAIGRPFREEDLLNGPLESTCEPYAIAKIAGIKMCESYNRQYGTDFVVAVAPNVYGPRQRYDFLNAQVLPSLIKKFHEAKFAGSAEVAIWGTGIPVRDFLFVDDLSDACLFLMNGRTTHYMMNIGSGDGHPIRDLAAIIKKVVGYTGSVRFDTSKPGGAAMKLLDISRMKASGWSPNTSLEEGIRATYGSFLHELEKREVRTYRISHIGPCEKDSAALAASPTFHQGARAVEQPDSYRGRVVLKPWGYEFLVFENDVIAVWLLFLSKGNATSMHSHLEKKTSLINLSGKAMSNTFSSRHYLDGGDAVVVGKGVFHSTKVLSENGLFLLEIETPPCKTDLVRLSDNYGRELSGYEGVSEMVTANLESFGYFDFDESKAYSSRTHETDRFSVTIEVFVADEEFTRKFAVSPEGLYTSCRGALYDGDGAMILAPGDTQKCEALSAAGALHIQGKTILLKTVSRDK